MHNALKQRNIKRLVVPLKTSDGAGVTLRRAIGTMGLGELDPFLLFDHFGSENPDDYIAGFPMHPHRGIETVTYMLAGKIRHRDSVGNSGVISAGGVQWMTAGGGIMHEEMPEMTSGRLEGFQLWVNLKAAEKLQPPSYQEFDADSVPTASDSKGNKIKVIAGSFEGLAGAVRGISSSPAYLDVEVGGSLEFVYEFEGNPAVFAYLYRGSLEFTADDGETAHGKAPVLVMFEDEGSFLRLKAGPEGASLLVIKGEPIGEPIARYGPFVMNTKEEIQTALDELRDGTFIKQ